MDVLSALLEVIAPTRCAGCDLPGALLCERCRSAIQIVDPVYACPTCGAPYGCLTCTECWQTEYGFIEARSSALLEPPISRCVTLYKDGGERRLASVLGEMLLRSCDEWLGWAEAVVPVPATAAAMRRRGFDHARLLAEHVAVESDLPCLHLLVSCGARDQRWLGRAERLANTDSGFAASSSDTPPRYVLLLDDVMTTGATLDAASRALLAAGVSEVRACTAARVW